MMSQTGLWQDIEQTHSLIPNAIAGCKGTHLKKNITAVHCQNKFTLQLLNLNYMTLKWDQYAKMMNLHVYIYITQWNKIMSSLNDFGMTQWINYYEMLIENGAK
jgi:hypothetical protein